MPVVMEASLVIEDCRRELDRLRKTVAEFRAAAELSREFLTGAAKIQMDCSPMADVSLQVNAQTWRERATQARALAELTGEPEAKLALLDVARRYDHLAS